MHFSRVVFYVKSPDSLARFYVNHLGMSASQDGDELLLGYGRHDTRIELRSLKAGWGYTHTNTDRYWKIGITLPNVDIAHEQLCAAGVGVGQPRQFLDGRLYVPSERS